MLAMRLPPLEMRRVGAETHRAAEVAAVAALLELVAPHPFGHEADDRLGRLAELGRACPLDAAQVSCAPRWRPSACRSRCRSRDLAFARELGGEDLALGAALAETTRHQDAAHAFEVRRRILALEDLALDPLELDLDAVGDAAVHQGLDQRLVGVLQPRVLADDGDGHLALGRGDAARDGLASA